MRIFCIFQNYPDELAPLAQYFSAMGHEVTIASQRNFRGFGGIGRAALKKCNSGNFPKDYIGHLTLSLKNARNADDTFRKMDKHPDIVLSCANNGVSTGLPYRFFESFIVAYADMNLFYLRERNSSLYEARLLLQKDSLEKSDLCFIRVNEQQSWAAKHNFFPLMIDTDFFQPDDTEKSGVFVLEDPYAQTDMEWLEICRQSMLIACLKDDPSMRVRLLQAVACETPVVANGFLPLQKGVKFFYEMAQKGELAEAVRKNRKRIIQTHDMKKLVAEHANMLIMAWEKWKSEH